MTTNTSEIYKVSYLGKPAILKVLYKRGLEDEKNAPIALKLFDGKGAVNLLKNDLGAHLLEYIDGKNLVHLVNQGKDKEATCIICDILNKLHCNQKKINMQLTPLSDRYLKLFEKAKSELNIGLTSSVFVKAARVADDILKNQKDCKILHGDLHHENILLQSNRGWLAIDPKGLYGDRAFDAVNALFNPKNFKDIVINEKRLFTTAEALSKNLKIDIGKLLNYAFTYGCLSAVWSVEDGFSPEETLALVNLIEKYL